MALHKPHHEPLKLNKSHVEETGIEGLVFPESSLVDKVACGPNGHCLTPKLPKTDGADAPCIQYLEGPYGSGCKVRQTVAPRQEVCQTGQIQLQPKQGQEGLAAVLLHDCIRWQRLELQHACPRYSTQEYRSSTYWTDHTVAPNIL